jgi:hypothetical protein
MRLIKGYALPPGADRIDYGGLVQLSAFGANTPVSTPQAYPHTPPADPRMKPIYPPVIGAAQPGSLPYSSQVYAQAVAAGVAPDPYAAVPALHGFGGFGGFGAARGVVAIDSLAMDAWFGTSEESSDADRSPSTGSDVGQDVQVDPAIEAADPSTSSPNFINASARANPTGASPTGSSSNTPLIVAGVAIAALFLLGRGRGSSPRRRR